MKVRFTFGSTSEALEVEAPPTNSIQDFRKVAIAALKVSILAAFDEAEEQGTMPSFVLGWSGDQEHQAWVAHNRNIPERARREMVEWEGNQVRAPTLSVCGKGDRVSCITFDGGDVLYFRGIEVALQDERYIPWDPLVYTPTKRRRGYASLELACDAINEANRWTKQWGVSEPGSRTV